VPNSPSHEDLKEQDDSLNPGRYVGVVIEEDGKTEEEFIEDLLNLDGELATLNRAAAKLQTTVSANIKALTGGLMKRGRIHLFDANPSANPKGMRPSSQGCEERATLGNRQRDSNPDGVVASANAPRMVSQPRWGWINLDLLTQGSSFLATLGFRGNPVGIRRGCLNHTRILHSEIPKGFCPPAQGCEERATLGQPFNQITTPTGCAHASDLCRNRYPPFTSTSCSRRRNADHCSATKLSATSSMPNSAAFPKRLNVVAHRWRC